MAGVRRLLLIIPAAALLAACGGSTTSAPAPRTAPAPTTSSTPTQARPRPAPTTTRPATPSPSGLQAEATSAATGDIPDNQVFLVWRDRPAGWQMKYPEGWAQSGAGARLTFRDKNNVVRVIVVQAPRPSTTSIRAELARLKGVRVQKAPQPLALAGSRAFKVVYTTESTPKPVTGTRVVLTVDRYYVARGGKVAIVDLGTPVGVDNVDAYRLMIESFRWR
jgi:hypothetical protein